MPMRPRSARTASLGLIVASALTVSACGGESVQFAGQDVANAEDVLAAADDAFADAVEAGVSAGTSTVSDDSRCYFREAGEDGVEESAFCGPVRQLGGSEDDAWLPIPLDEDGDTEDGIRLAVTPTEPSDLTSVDSGELFRPDGAEPVAADSLDEPQAPEAPLADSAVVMSLDQAGVDAEFEQLDEPYTLSTPSVTVTVDAAATLDVVPGGVVDALAGASDDSEGLGDEGEFEEDESSGPEVPHYRPAEGQQASAWQITVGPPPQTAPVEDDSFFSEPEDARNASTSFALAAGDQRLTVTGSIGYDSGEESQTLTVGCESVPCESIEQGQYLLVASTAEGATPSLVATVDGADQSLSLEDGSLASDVSQVAYNREQLSQQVSTTWPNKTVTVRTEEQLNADLTDAIFVDDTTFSYGGEVQQVFLSPFDYAQGWAPAGKAWLTVPIVNRSDELSGSGELSLDQAASMTLKVGDQRISAQPGAGREDWMVFQVDEKFTKGTVVYSPTGSVNIYDRTYPLKTDDPQTLDIALP